MKPHISKDKYHDPEWAWSCSAKHTDEEWANFLNNRLALGIGASPQEAYEDWLSSVEFCERMNGKDKVKYK